MTSSSQIVRIDPAMPDEGMIQLAVSALERGELVVAPTETRYGLLARADDEAALERVYEAKGRGLARPTSLFVQNRNDLDEYGEMTEASRLLAREFLPGPLTLVLASRKPWDPPRVVEGLIGLRWSSSAFIAGLVGQVSFTVTATSANMSGQEELSTVEEIEGALGEAVALYIDGGPLSNPVSTVVRCVESEVEVLREGAVSYDSIQQILKGAGLL